MRAFLSHSSKDKGFVEAVADTLRPGSYELDSLTFDAGLVNSQAIIEALKRSTLFCLFLSQESIRSPYVNFEVLLGSEFFARGNISRILIICLDDHSFSSANENIKFFNIVRKVTDPESCARLIQGHLISTSGDMEKRSHPFVGREAEFAELESQISDHARPLVKALLISGNPGSGRRTLVHKFYEAQFPHVGRIFPQVEIDPFDGLEELYRTVLMKLRPSIGAGELITRAKSFQIASEVERRRLIAQLFNSLLPAKEAACVLDTGGILNDAGGFSPEIDEVISQLDARPHPPIAIISRRMVPKRHRRSQNDIAYAAVRSLKWDVTLRLISRLLKERSVIVSADQISELAKLSDGHPYNIYRIIDDVNDIGADVFLANPSDFLDWKHRQSSEYISDIIFSDYEKIILGILKIIPQLDFESILVASKLSSDCASEALQRLDYLHVIEAHDNIFLIAPALRMAVERDTRIKLSQETLRDATKALAVSLTVRIESGLAPMSLLNAAILSSIESGEAHSELAASLMLPSHQVWLCKHHYDQRHWADSIRYGLDALKGSDRLSLNGLVAACRYVCLASARVGEEGIFTRAITKLERSANDDWSRSNVSYLKGFNLRNKGKIAAAEDHFRTSNRLSPDNHSALRELAAIALVRGNLSDAEALAREALSHATRNPYVLDILISVLIRKHGRQAVRNSEINDLLSILEVVGEESGRSFYTTRKAEFEHICGDNKLALKYIDKALNKTPFLFDPHRIKAEILLKDGNKSRAYEEIEIMRQMVESGQEFDRRSNYRSYLETLSHYLVSVGQYNDAKGLFNDMDIFSQTERDSFIKEIEIAEGYTKFRR